MKKNLKRISITFIILTLIYTIFYVSSVKATSANLSANSVSVESGKSFSITITSSISLCSWSISTDSGKCVFSGVSGTDNAQISGSSITDMSANGTKTLATYNFKAPTVTKDTTYKISFSGTQLSDANAEYVDNASCSATITVKAPKSSNPSGSGSSTTTKPSGGSTTTKTPTFKSANKTVYTTNDCNLRSSWSTTSNATSVKKGTELKLTGTSSEKINGYVWYRVTYNGATKYIANTLITETKPKEDEKSSNKNLASLSIEGIELTPAFNKDTTQYTAKVEGDVTELKIDSKAEDSKAKVTVEGNKNLTEGDNVIKIKVTAEDETTRTYFITVTVGEKTEIDNSLKLSELKIERVNFEGSFNPDTHNYKLSLSSYVDKLDITATPSQADATVEIIGNKDFEQGKNTVTILLTSANGKETATYQIEVEVPAGLEVEKSNEPSMVMYIVIGVVVAAVIIGVFILIRRKLGNNDDTLEDNEETFEAMPKAKKKSYNNKEENDFSEKLDNNDDDQDKPKKSKGRHSI